jgi:hypothetical protein
MISFIFYVLSLVGTVIAIVETVSSLKNKEDEGVK